MAVVSVAQASARLGIDAKTLHRWLEDAQLSLQGHPDDGRKKGLCEEQVHLLARLHQRRLTTPAEQAPALSPSDQLELPALVRTLAERLDTMQAQLTALQQQMSTLTHRLEPPQPAPALPPAPSPSQPTSKAARRTTPPTPSASPARRPTPPKAASKPVHVIPRVEYGADGGYVVICPKEGRLPFEPDTPAWFVWLAENHSFRFVGKAGHFSAHHERYLKNGAWRAHRQIRNHSYTLPLAPAAQLTIAVLEQAAEVLQAHLT